MPEPYPNVLDLSRRVKDLERRAAVTEERFREYVDAQNGYEDRDSSADISMHPGAIRLRLRNLPPWVVAWIAVVLAVVIVGVIMRG